MTTSSMTINLSESSLHLIVPPFIVYLAQYPSGFPIPSSLFQADLPFLSFTRTPMETTVLVGVSDDISPASPREGRGQLELSTLFLDLGLPAPKCQDGPYAVLRVKGPLDLSTRRSTAMELTRSTNRYIK
jgi:hypothetical protein